MYFTLDVFDQNEEQIISNLRGLNKVAFYALTEYGSSDEETSWQGREEELKAFSLNYPGVLFQLDVDDERHSEYSREYYKDGQMQKVIAELVYPSCIL